MTHSSLVPIEGSKEPITKNLFQYYGTGMYVKLNECAPF